jgi:hypothetical protein
MKLSITPVVGAKADVLFEDIKRTLRNGDLWRVNDDGKIYLQIPKTFGKHYCPQYFEKSDDPQDRNSTRLTLVYREQDPLCEPDPSLDPDNEHIARYISEMINHLFLHHRNEFSGIMIREEQKADIPDLPPLSRVLV